MMLSNDGKKGCTHLEQLCNRNKIDKTKPITLEILAAHSVVQLADLITVYNKHAGPKEEYEQTPTKLDVLAAAAAETKPKTLKDNIKEQGNIQVEPFDMVEFCKAAPVKGSDVKLPAKSYTHKFKIKGFSTKKKTLLDGLEVVPIKNPKTPSLSKELDKFIPLNERLELLPVGKPKLTRQKGIHKTDLRKFNEDALLKAFEFANRVERWRLGEIKTQPAPKKLSNKYRP